MSDTKLDRVEALIKLHKVFHILEPIQPLTRAGVNDATKGPSGSSDAPKSQEGDSERAYASVVVGATKS